jgi:microcystin-dependent protein
MSVDTTVKGVLTTNTALSGTMTTPDGAILNAGDRCLVTGQTDPLYNGVYYVNTTAWTFDTEFHLFPAVAARVYSGNYYKHSEWILNSESDVIPGVNAQDWVLEKLGSASVPGTGMTRDVDGRMVLDATGVTPGTYQNPNLTITEDGRLVAASSSNIIRSYIEGLEVQYVNATQLRVLAGLAYIPGLNRMSELSVQVTISPTLSADSWYYVYLYDVNGVGQIEISTTWYETYLGVAAHKIGDTTRRYVGEFGTNASAQIDSTLVVSHNLASTWFPGRVEFATVAETHAGTDATRAISPYSLAQKQLIPVGTIMMWPDIQANNPPGRWQKAQGQSALRSAFPELFALIGTRYGEGDTPGSTFAYPDLRARFPLGASSTVESGVLGGAATHTLTAAEMAPHTHTSPHGGVVHNDLAASGGRQAVNNSPSSNVTGSGAALLGQAHNNMPPYISIVFIIRSLP